MVLALMKNRLIQYLHSVLFGVFALEFEAHARTREVGMQSPVNGCQHAIKEHALNAHVIMEILHVAKIRDSTARMNMQRWPTVRGKF